MSPSDGVGCTILLSLFCDTSVGGITFVSCGCDDDDDDDDDDKGDDAKESSACFSRANPDDGEGCKSNKSIGGTTFMSCDCDDDDDDVDNAKEDL